MAYNYVIAVETPSGRVLDDQIFNSKRFAFRTLNWVGSLIEKWYIRCG
jgi:hypothetical protein